MDRLAARSAGPLQAWDTGHPEFYALVNAQTVLIPISKSGYRAMHDGTYPNNPGTAWNADAEQNALVVHKAFEGTVTLEI